MSSRRARAVVALTTAPTLVLGLGLGPPAAAVPVTPPAVATVTAPPLLPPTGAGVLDLTSGLPVTGGDAAPPQVTEPAVEPAVRDAMDAAGEVAVVVRLVEQADPAALVAVGETAAADAARTPGADAEEARGRAVVDTLRATGAESRARVAGLLATQASAGHASDLQEFWVFNGFAATVDAVGLDVLVASPDVAEVQLDAAHELPDLLPASEPLLPSWSLEAVAAPDVWGEYGVRGEGVVVGIMDSGADATHPALAGSWRGRDGDVDASWFAATGEPYATPDDGNGHGTHVTGSIVGAPPGEVVGVAPEAEWIAAKIFRDGGSTSDSIIHAGFQWMLAPGGDPAAAPDVVNNSWGSAATYDTEFSADVDAWLAAGIVPVFAAGNDGPGAETIGSPGSFPTTIAVGNTDRNDVINPSSSRGPVTWGGVTTVKPELSAPGTDVRSAWPTRLGGGYEELTGTSMASPHVTGVVALLLAADPTLTVDEVRELLTGTARVEDHMGALPDDRYGAGVVDAYAAVTRAVYAGVVSGTAVGPDGPVAGATVAVDEAGASTTTDADGAYALDLPAGEHEITASAYGYRATTVTVTVVQGETTTLALDLTAAPVQPVSGTVDGPEGPVAGAAVVLVGTPVEPVRTDDDGRFDLDVAEGTYELRVSAAGFQPWSTELDVDGAEALTITLVPLAVPAAAGWSQAQNNATRAGLSPERLAPASLVEGWTVDLGPGATFSSPVVGDGLVVIATEDGQLRARDAETGAAVWTHAGSAPRRGVPAVADGTVVVGVGLDGGVVGLDASDGAVRWTVETPGRRTVYAAPAVVDGTAYVATGPTESGSDAVLAVDVATGEVAWTADVGALVYAGPAVADGTVVVGNGSTGELIGLDAATGERRWTLPRTDDHFVASPSVVDGVAYVATTGDDGSSGSVLAVDAATGALLWEQPGNGDGQGGTPTVYGGLVITTSHASGAISAYDRADGALVWRHAVSGAASAAVLASDDGFVVGGSQLDNRFWALDAATGDEVWSLPTGRNVTSAPALADGRLLLLDGDGVLRSLLVTSTVRGTVTGPDGGLAATVTLAGTDQVVATDPVTGAYELVTRPGAGTLEIRAYGHEQVDVPVDLVAGETLVVDRELAPVGDGAVTGRVVTEDGEPVTGATVELVGTPVDAVQTGADGTFQLDPVAAGRYTLAVSAAGLEPAAVGVLVVTGEVTALDDVVLRRYEIALTGDHEGRVLAELEALGYLVEPTTYAQVTDHPDAYALVVANGAQDDPGQAAFLDFLQATDDAGTSVVFLDQWSLGWGATNLLQRHVGDPADLPDDHGDSGRVTVRALAEHPLTAGLPLGEAVDLLVRGNDWSAYAGWLGTTVAELATDEHGVAGGVLGFQPRSTGGAHVLVGSLAAAASWGVPATDWAPAAETIFANAVAYGLAASYGEVTGTVVDVDGAPLAGVTVEVVDGLGGTTTDAEGTYSILLPPGAQTLRFSAVGSSTEVREVVVEAGATQVVDVTLETSGLGALGGTVTSGRDGAAVAGATVEVVELGRSAVTADDGSWSLDGVPAGTYELRVAAAGHLSSTEPVTVAAGTTTVVDVVLAPAPVVGVLGDYAADGVVAFLTANEITAEPVEWADVARVGDFDVIVFNDPSDPGEAPFLAFLEAMDAAQVSGVFGDDWLGAAIDGLLVDHVGDPTATDWLSADGTVSYRPLVPDHPIFAGVDGDALMFADTSTYGTWFTGYSGIPLAETVGEVEGVQGVGVAYAPRTPGSVHVLLGGLALTLSGHSPGDGWAEDAPQVYLNAIRYAAAPGLGTVAGSVTDTDGNPLAATVEVTGTSVAVETDPADGAYEVPLAPGTYELVITSFGYEPTVRTVVVEPGAVTELDVALEETAAGGVAGTVTALGGVDPPGAGVLAGAGVQAGEPVGGAVVRVLGTPRETITDDDGRYALDLLEPGAYELEVVADGHVRSRVAFEVVAAETTTVDVALRVSPRVGVLDEDASVPHATGYLRWWGYDAVEIGWGDTAAVAGLDLVVANLASYPNLDPGAAGWADFEDAVNRAGVPVVWLDQLGRGSFQWLEAYDGDPASHGSDRGNDDVIVTAVDEDHPLLAGLPTSFPLVAPDAEYSWFGDLDGTTVATVSSSLDPAAGGGAVGVRPRGAGAVDVLLGSLSISTYGWPAYGDVPADSWTPEAERLLRNGIGYALDTDALGAEVRGRVVDTGGDPVASSVTVIETGATYAARASDGSFVVPLEPGTWTLRAEAFGHSPVDVEVVVTAGEVRPLTITLELEPAGSAAGLVSDVSTGAAVAGATITLEGTELVVETGPDGRYELAPVPVGSWQVLVEAAGYMDQRVPVTVQAGQAADGSAQLEPARTVAVVEDASSDSIEHLLEDEGYVVEAFEDTQLTVLAPRVDDFRLVIVNGTVATAQHGALTAVLDAAAAASVSVIVAGQWGGGAIDDLREIRGDPAATAWGFVEDTTVDLTPSVEHPVFAGFPVGGPIPLMGNATENQQWLAYEGYSGTQLADLTTSDPVDGPVIGGGVGYRATSAGSVEILLASLSAGTYGRPDEPVGAAGRWTPEAVRVYLNAVAWATETERGAVQGTVTGDGAPVDGATVTAVELGSSTTTDADGSYELALPDGEHTIRVEALGFEPAEQTVEVVDSATVRLDVELVPTPRGSVVGTVTDEDGPVAGATVRGSGVQTWSATSGDDGGYDSGPLLPGTYVVTVEAPGHLPVELEITVEGGAQSRLDAELDVIDVGVLGDWDGDLTELLVQQGQAATELAWDAGLDLDGYAVLVINGGEPDQATYEAVVDEALAEGVSLVHTGTWGVDQGGVRLLERFTDRVAVAEQGYGDGRVRIVGYDEQHPLFRRMTDPARLITRGGYYSVLDSYVGEAAAIVRVGGGGEGAVARGLGVGFDWRTPTSLEVVLSSSAVTGTVGPGRGWTRDHARLVRAAVVWARTAEPPGGLQSPWEP